MRTAPMKALTQRSIIYLSCELWIQENVYASTTTEVETSRHSKACLGFNTLSKIYICPFCSNHIGQSKSVATKVEWAQAEERAPSRKRSTCEVSEAREKMIFQVSGIHFLRIWHWVVGTGVIMTRDDTKGSNLRTCKTPVNSIEKFEFYLEDNGESVKGLTRKVA